MTLWFAQWMLLLLPFISLDNSRSVSKADTHPFYVSVTEINHNASEKTLEISCKAFADDMEDALKQNFRTTVDLTNAAQQERAKNFLSQYVQQHLRIVANGQQVPLQFIGFEKESESVYCYLEAGNIQALKKLDVYDAILHDFTKDQINIMHVTYGGKRQSTRLSYPDKQAHFDF